MTLMDHLIEVHHKAISDKISVGVLLRKMGLHLFPTIELSKDGDDYFLSTINTFKPTIIKFRPGIEFNESTIDGREVVSLCTFENDETKLIHEQNGEKLNVIIREFTETEMVATMSVDGVQCVRFYLEESIERVPPPPPPIEHDEEEMVEEEDV